MTTTASGAKAAFAADYDAPIPYMQRTRDHYQVLGFNPYRWADFVEVPFTPLRMPLDRARVALITTAAPVQPGVGIRPRGRRTTRRPSSTQVHPIATDPRPISGSRTSATTDCTRRRRTSIRTCRWRTP